MKINIATTGRFHLLDLARELDNCGHEVCFYSYVPTARAMKFGLKKECSKSFFILMLPFLFLLKLTKRAQWAENINMAVMDFIVAQLMKPCDVFIGLGGLYSLSFKYAKKRFNAVTLLEWGSKHVLVQDKITENDPQNKVKKRNHNFFNKRALHWYNNADFISIPSTHVKESFLLNGIPDEKLFINPYGVDLSMFYPTALDTIEQYDLIMVGGWRYVKGCDLLTETCEKYGFSLIHVGSVVGSFPQVKKMKDFGVVDQKLLVDYYAKAKVMVLPSRADGFGMVLSQAIRCGLPIVCSKDTGGADLKYFLNDKRWIIEMEEFTADDLGRCINEALSLSEKQNDVRSYAEDVISHLSWDAYGKRYCMFLRDVFKL